LQNKNDNGDARMAMAVSSTSPRPDSTKPCALKAKGYLVLANKPPPASRHRAVLLLTWWELILQSLLIAEDSRKPAFLPQQARHGHDHPTSLPLTGSTNALIALKVIMIYVIILQMKKW
jgi:hypothetical protein